MWVGGERCRSVVDKESRWRGVEGGSEICGAFA